MKRFFEGWYYKQQVRGKTLAVIPGRTGDGAFVQVVTDNLSHNIPYPLSEYTQTGRILRIGGNDFTCEGITLDLRGEAFTLTGSLRYGQSTPLKSDIMGPFRFFPMECRHGVVSMRHTVSGDVKICGETLDFNGGVGYIESDCGRSFPRGYAWAQFNALDADTSVMASVAKIPFCGLHFWGCIAALWLDGCEYKLATYLGASIRRYEHGILELKQGCYRLIITAEPGRGQPLAAPEHGVMRRTIRESASCPARFQFWRGDDILLDAESGQASYEYVPES